MGDDLVRLLLVLDQVQDPYQHERDGLAEVQGLAGGGQDGVGLAEVGFEVGRRALGGAGEQGAGVGEHEPFTALPGKDGTVLVGITEQPVKHTGKKRPAPADRDEPYTLKLKFRPDDSGGR